jgi:hypothetical protein
MEYFSKLFIWGKRLNLGLGMDQKGKSNRTLAGLWFSCLATERSAAIVAYSGAIIGAEVMKSKALGLSVSGF